MHKSTCSSRADEIVCFFHEKSLEGAKSHQANTKKVRRYATDLQYTNILQKLAAGDMVVVEETYLLNYLTTFYNHKKTIGKT